MGNHSSTGTLLRSFLSSYSRSRRLEDKIRKLCADAVATTDPSQLNEILEQLAQALREHTDRVRKMAAARPGPRERRAPSFE